MSDVTSSRLAFASLSLTSPTAFDLQPGPAASADLADMLGALAIRKLRFTGEIAPDGSDSWVLTARLGATVVQPCAVTLAPVTTRIDQPVTRHFVPPERFESPAGTETEIPEDDDLEPIGTEINLEGILAEALALAMPAYPRSPGATLGEAIYAPAGISPMTDADARPFAALAGLKDKLENEDDKS